ncbi:hypothetical protein PUN28_018073 [Cardiocondyla obscurior]|uniref:Uncharacterized protein n=1 Tax=Cardiocondyla obscurior TaxID=286306 RepID=A0AAW2EGP5_9HYME
MSSAGKIFSNFFVDNFKDCNHQTPCTHTHTYTHTYLYIHPVVFIIMFLKRGKDFC